VEPGDDQGAGRRGFVVVMHGSDDDRQTSEGIAAAPEAGNGIVGASAMVHLCHAASPSSCRGASGIPGLSLPYFSAALVTRENW